MKRVKEYLVLPLALIAMEFILGDSMDPWYSIYLFPLRAWVGIGKVFGSLAVCAIFILLIVFLYLFVFTEERLSTIPVKIVLKSMIAPLLTYLITKFLISYVLVNYFVTLYSQKVLSGAGYMLLCSVTVLPHILLIYLIVRQLLKSLQIPVLFHKTARVIFLLVCIALYFAYSFNLLWFMNMINEANAHQNEIMGILFVGMKLSLDPINQIYLFFNKVILILLDLNVFIYLHRSVSSASHTSAV